MLFVRCQTSYAYCSSAFRYQANSERQWILLELSNSTNVVTAIMCIREGSSPTQWRNTPGWPAHSTQQGFCGKQIITQKYLLQHCTKCLSIHIFWRILMESNAFQWHCVNWHLSQLPVFQHKDWQDCRVIIIAPHLSAYTMYGIDQGNTQGGTVATVGSSPSKILNNITALFTRGITMQILICLHLNST
jgi:hypothetical protein